MIFSPGLLTKQVSSKDSISGPQGRDARSVLCIRQKLRYRVT